ncbi:MaoC family dehydratase [Ectothiorhodospiraceae bacterium WFHF3C12]|nr:MaoC family dehydratase [Ectothiorhodospiraceae bacterium WFHF3C12]
MSELEQALRENEGKEVGTSDWVLVDQARINAFADATDDHQWIHVDEERAARELPQKSTIAHGFLTLSLIAGIMPKIIQLPGVAMSLNYGLNRVRFVNPVPAGSRVRLHVKLKEWERTDKGFRVTWESTMELEGADKPACIAESLAMLQPADGR